MNILNFTPETDPQIWALLQPPNDWNALEADARLDLDSEELPLNETFEQFERTATDLETDWEEIR